MLVCGVNKQSPFTFPPNWAAVAPSVTSRKAGILIWNEQRQSTVGDRVEELQTLENLQDPFWNFVSLNNRAFAVVLPWRTRKHCLLQCSHSSTTRHRTQSMQNLRQRSLRFAWCEMKRQPKLSTKWQIIILYTGQWTYRSNRKWIKKMSGKETICTCRFFRGEAFRALKTCVWRFTSLKAILFISFSVFQKAQDLTTGLKAKHYLKLWVRSMWIIWTLTILQSTKY